MMIERIKIAFIAACMAWLLTACGAVHAGEEQAMGSSLALATATATADVDADPDATTDTSSPPTDDGTDTEDTEAPPADETGDEDEAEDGDDGGGIGPLAIAAIVLIIAAIGALLYRSVSRSGSSSAVQATRAPAQSIDLNDRVLGDISWFNEQLSLDLLSAEPNQAVDRWRGERPRIEGLTRDCQRLEESTGDPVWGALAAEVSTLAQSLDTATMARSNPSTDPVVTRQALDVVNRHRSQLSGLSFQARRH